MSNAEFSEAAEQSRQLTEKMVDQLADHLLNGLPVEQVMREIRVALMIAPQDMINNALSWLLITMATERAAQKGTSDLNE